MDSVRNGVLGLVEYANRQGYCLQLNGGRSLGKVVREFSWPPTLISFDGEGMEIFTRIKIVLFSVVFVQPSVYLPYFVLFCLVACGGYYYGICVSWEEYNGVGSWGMSVMRNIVQ